MNKKIFVEKYGLHNFENLSAAISAAQLAGVPWTSIKKAINSLPQVKFREEIIRQNKNFNPVRNRSPQGGRSRPAAGGRAVSNGVKIINDSTATSPDATIAALKRFSNPPAGGGEIILITGGTDKNLEYRDWAKIVKKYIRPENLYLLNGSATKKMLTELQKIGYFKKEKLQLFEDLSTLLKAVKLQITNYKLPITVLFSPGAASFEKFKNEFDRGEKFNRLSRFLL